ncbi:hypothetical protein B0H11DRAFT_356275 [Mycena galericulata]|nr:hypothetical protein B0H11DRAFT_356275 [Mycena galericulata]
MLNMFFPGISHAVTGKISPKMKRVRPERAIMHEFRSGEHRMRRPAPVLAVREVQSGGDLCQFRAKMRHVQPLQAAALPAGGRYPSCVLPVECDGRKLERRAACGLLYLGTPRCPVPATRPTSAVASPYLLPGLHEGYHHPYNAPISFIIAPPVITTDGALPIPAIRDVSPAALCAIRTIPAIRAREGDRPASDREPTALRRIGIATVDAAGETEEGGTGAADGDGDVDAEGEAETETGGASRRNGFLFSGAQSAHALVDPMKDDLSF